MLILCAPPLLAATVYMVLGRMIRAFDAEHLSSMRPKWLTFVFAMNDVICFCTQVGGAGVQVTGDPKVMDIGKKVVLAGLIFSLFVFALFRGYRCDFSSTTSENAHAYSHNEPRPFVATVYVDALCCLCGSDGP